MATRTERQTDGQQAMRGSEQLLRERGLPEKQLRELIQISQRNARLVYWFPKGQPIPDSILGAVLVPAGKAGAYIDRVHKLEGLQLRLDVFPLGIPIPHDILVRFEQGFGHH